MAKYSVSFVVKEENIPFFEAVFDEKAEAFLWNLIEEGDLKGKWRAEAYFEELPEEDDLNEWIKEASADAGIDSPEFIVNEIVQKNWLEESFKSFPPISFGRYYIYGSHITDEPPANRICLQIDAATAFGSGEHATTQGCLMALDEILQIKQPKNVLDLGCGSGILAMATFKVMNEKPYIEAVDIDPVAVEITTQNAVRNKTDMLVFQSTGYENVGKNYDLIFANILAAPLVEMAPDLEKHLSHGGYAILSGFLEEQKEWVQKAHENVGLEIVSYRQIKEWGTLVVKRK